MSELKKALNKKLAGNREDVIDSPFHIRYTEFGADLYMNEKLIKSFEDKGKLLNAVWNRDWEIILKATKEYGRTRRKKVMIIPNKIIIHCSSTPKGVDYSTADIDKWHRQRGFRGIGYHYVIRLDGKIEKELS